MGEHGGAVGAGTPEGIRALTSREREILHLIALGHGHKTISQELALAPKTVAYHVTKLRRVFGAPNLPALVALAFVAGVLNSDLFS